MHDPTSTHPDSATLDAFASGQLSGATETNVRVHLQGCVACRARVARFFILQPDRPAAEALRGASGARPTGRLRWAQQSVLVGVLALMALVGWVAVMIDGGRTDTAVAEDEEPEISSPAQPGLESPTPPPAAGGSGVDRGTAAITTKEAPADTRTPEVATTKHSPDTANAKTPADQSPTVDEAATSLKTARRDRTDDASLPITPSPRSDESIGRAQNARAAARLSSLAFFNRKDLTGWDCPEGYWRVTDGAIVGTPRPGDSGVVFLCSQKSYRDFDLRFRVLLPDGVGVAGVQFRSRLTNATQFNVMGPRCVICGKDSDQDFPAGSLVFDQPGKSNIRPKSALANKHIRPGENHFHIRCEGKLVRIKINGAPIVSGKYDWLPDEGIIAFRLDGAHPPREIRFSAIQFTDLAASSSLAATPGEGFSDPAIASAEVTYATTVEKANRNLDGQFDKHIDRLRAKKHDDGEDPLVAVLVDERKVFAEKGFIPWSEPMRSSSTEYLKTINVAQEKLEGLFKTAVQSAQKKGDDKRVAALQQEEQSVLAPHIVAIAEMVVADGEPRGARIEFRSDRLYSNSNDSDSAEVHYWSLNGGRLILEHPDPDQPYVVERNGKSFRASAEQNWRFVAE